MSFRRSRPLLISALSAAVFAVAPAAQACGSSGFSYAGVSSRQTVFGVGATITTLATPGVQNGHVAGWVGVGGPGLGPHGSTEWIQVGFSGFPGLSVGSLYYEVALPGHAPTYHEVMSSVPTGARHRLAVLELARHHGYWRVWVDGHAVSRAWHLPGSHGAWRGVATAESWGGGVPACNTYAYRFDRVRIARTAGGSWRLLDAVYRMHQGDNHLLLSRPHGFVARTTTITRSAPRVSADAAAKPAAGSPAKPAPASSNTAAAFAPVAQAAAAAAPPVDSLPAETDTAPPTYPVGSGSSP